MVELWIKVPSPFFGVETVGLSLRCDSPPGPGPLPDIPFFVEGEAAMMAPLADQLRLLPQRDRFVDCQADGEAYGWTNPISLSDEVIIMAFQDRSLSEAGASQPGAARNRLTNQLVPMVFPFLRDCVRVAGLRLNSQILVQLDPGQQPRVELSLPLEQIVSGNGRKQLGSI